MGGPTVAPKVQAALDAAMLNLEPDIEVDVTDVLKNSSSQAIKGVQVHAQKQKQRIAASKVNAESCPKARGLVPK